MLNTAKIYTTIPVTDVDRAKTFYGQKLGLKVDQVMADGIMAVADDGTGILLYQRPPSHAEHTLASFNVTDIEATVAELKNNGVVFEQYDMPGLKTDASGIATHPDAKSAWFKDPDGNILAVTQVLK